MVATLNWADPNADWSVDLRNRSWGHTNRASNSTWAEQLDDLLRIRQLENDWDGQGAEAPDVKLVDSALSLALLMNQNGIPAPDRIVGSVTGTVIFEWQTTDGQYTELEVVEPYVAEWFADGPGEPPRSTTMDFPELMQPRA